MTDTQVAQPAPRQRESVALSEPIRRGEQEIATLALRKPKAGELRGLSLQDVITSDITALLTLIPRIAEPVITPDEANGLEPEDLAAIGGTIRGFFMTKAEREIVEMMIAEQRPKT